MVSIGIVGRTGQYVKDVAVNPPINSAATKWRSNISAVTSTGIWQSRLTSEAGAKKQQLEHKRKRAEYLHMNEQEDLHTLRCVVLSQVARKRGPESELPKSNARWQHCDKLGRAQEKLLLEALNLLTYERDAYSS